MTSDDSRKRLRPIEDWLSRLGHGPLDPDLDFACLKVRDATPAPDGWDVDHLGLTPDQKIVIDRTCREHSVLKQLRGDAKA
jgi:hypothetical protein